MGTKPSYFKIGLFVILATVLVLAAAVVFGSGLLAQEKLYFETYFDESVTGLTVGAPVELRGVRIGLVDKITFVREDYRLSVQDAEMPRYEHYVMVLCSVSQETLPAEPAMQKQCLEQMVERGLRVRISSNLLTGQAYLQADYLDPNRFDLLEVTWEPKNLYIPSAPSEFSTLKDSVDKVLRRLQELDIDKLVKAVEAVLSSIDSAIADANVGEISKDMKALLAEARTQVKNLDTKKISLAARDTLASVDKAVEDVNTPAISDEIRSLLAEVRQTNEHLQRLLVSSESHIPTANLEEVISSLNKTLVRLDRLVSTERPQVELILANFEKISENIKDLTETLKRHPSDLFFSEPPSQPEVSK
jgi:phospholipid/cholesterol/gamma-HCH transport system substrate-binding protein/paraquat-inducible protein B